MLFSIIMEITMNSLIKTILVLSITATITITTTTNAANINQRQHSQRNRIKQGIKSGELTTREAKQLIKHGKMIKQKEQAYKSDGILTIKERLDLQKRLDKQNQAIYNQKHDRQSK